MMELVEIMEERNDPGASSVVPLTPIPPHLTGSEACTQDPSSSLTLHNDDTASLRTLSKWIVSDEVLHGAVRSRYWRRGIAKQLLRRKNASCAAILDSLGRTF
jgi:hypothetical protein